METATPTQDRLAAYRAVIRLSRDEDAAQEAERLKKRIAAFLEAVRHRPKPVRLSTAHWIRHQGPKGGRGWKSIRTGKVVYQENMPGDGKDHEGPSEPHPAAPGAQKPTAPVLQKSSVPTAPAAPTPTTAHTPHSPQIDPENISALLQHLQKQGVKVVSGHSVPVHELQPVGEVTREQITTLANTPLEQLQSPVVASQDGFALNGQVRVAALKAKDPKAQIGVHAIGMTKNAILAAVKQFGGQGGQGVAGAGTAGTAGKPTIFNEQELALPTKASQPIAPNAGYAALHAKGVEADRQLQALLNLGRGLGHKLGYKTVHADDSHEVRQQALNEPGGVVMLGPVKGEKRSTEKVEQELNGDWSQILDVARATIAVDSIEDVQKVVQAMRDEGAEFARKPKDRINNPLPVGYRDLLTNVKMPNGAIVEVQVHLKPMLRAKALGHKAYEVMRTIEGKAKAEGDRKMTPEEQTAWQTAFDESCKIYGDAWKESSGTAAPPVSPVPAMQQPTQPPQQSAKQPVPAKPRTAMSLEARREAYRQAWHGAALRLSIWVRHVGPRGGHGWRSSATGKVVYQDAMPGAHEHGSHVDAEPMPLFAQMENLKENSPVALDLLSPVGDNKGREAGTSPADKGEGEEMDATTKKPVAIDATVQSAQNGKHYVQVRVRGGAYDQLSRAEDDKTEVSVGGKTYTVEGWGEEFSVSTDRVKRQRVYLAPVQDSASTTPAEPAAVSAPAAAAKIIKKTSSIRNVDAYREGNILDTPDGPQTITGYHRSMDDHGSYVHSLTVRPATLEEVRAGRKAKLEHDLSSMVAGPSDDRDRSAHNKKAADIRAELEAVKSGTWTPERMGKEKNG